MANPFARSAPPMYAPQDLQAQQMQNQRAMQMAAMLRQQADQPLEQQTVTGAGPSRVVPISPLQGLARLLQSGVSAYVQDKADKKQMQISSEIQRRQQDALKELAPDGTFDDQSSMPETFGGGSSGGAPSQAESNPPSQKPKVDDATRKSWARALRTMQLNPDAGWDMVKDLSKMTPEQKNMAAMGQDPRQMGQLGIAEARKKGIIELQPGTTAIDLSNGQERFQPKVGEGISLNNGQASVLPGYAQSISSIEGAKASAQEGAKLLPLGYVGSDARPIGGTVGQYIGGDQQQTQQYPDFAPKGLIDANVRMANSIQDPQERQSFINARIAQVYGQKGLSDQQKDYAVQLFQSGLGHQLEQSSAGDIRSPRSGMPKLQSEEQKTFGLSVAKGAGEDLLKSRDQAKGAADNLFSINESRKSIASGAFLGAGADFKTDVAKAIKSVAGINIDPEKVSNSEYLRSTLGQGLLDNAKKLGVNPTDSDAKRLDAIIGTIAKDPKALSKALDFQEEMAIRSINKHNTNIADAEKRGLSSPYNLSVELPKFDAIQIEPIKPPTSQKNTSDPSRAKFLGFE